MANRIKIRHGNSIPTTSSLLPYELGWNTANKILYINDNNNAIEGIGLRYINTTDNTTWTADTLGATTSIAFTRANITGAHTTGHIVWLNANDIGTPFQLVVHDSSELYLYKRWKSSGTWGSWTKMNAGYADSAGIASKLTNLSSTDQASSSSTQRYVWFAYNDNVTGRPAYDANFVYRSDTKTLTIPRINLWRDGATTYGRLQWYHHNYKTWTNYMSNAASGTCPSGGTPSTLGNVTSWAIRSYIENSSGYGWLWESAAESNTGTPTARMALSAYDGTLHVAGLIKTTLNSNTVTIGSQNVSFCHIYNSASIPFIFNNSVLTTSGDLGNTSYPFNNIYLGAGGDKGIYYKGTKNTYRMIRFIDNTSDEYGNGISIGGGGQTIIGGGESADTMVAQAGTAGTEVMWICNDADIDFFPGQQNGYSATQKMTLNTSGNLLLHNGANAVIASSNSTARKIWVTTSSSYSSSYANGDIVLVKAS